MAGELAGVVDDPAALDPDPIGVGVQVLDPLLRRGDDLGRFDSGRLEAVLGLGAGLPSDLFSRFVGALKNARDLLANPLQGPAHGGLGRARGLKLGHELTGPLHVGIHGDPVITPQRVREVSVDHGDRVVGEGVERGGDLLKDRVLASG